ncbi:MAG: acyl carrier protein [Dongiaceae bacterium]
MGLSQDEVLAEIARMLEPYRKEQLPITPETDISRDLNIDSVTVLDLMMELEDKYDVSIPQNLVLEIRTVADLIATIQRVKEGV